MVKTYSNFGYDGCIVDIDVVLRSGIPAMDIIGLADTEVAEGRETVKEAIVNSGFKLPSERVILSLSPCDMKKDKDSLAATALAIMLANEGVDVPDVLVMGRLTETGELNFCAGIYAACEKAKEEGIKYAILPECVEASLVEGMTVKVVHNLAEARVAVDTILKPQVACDIKFSEIDDCDSSLDDYEGYDALKRAMLVAACGGHHMTAISLPDSGEEQLMQHFDQLLPELLPDEKKEVYKIASIAGLLSMIADGKRPFVMPHSSASIEGMCGGGIKCMPGAMSRAHRGVLFLRDALEFKTSVLHMLRVPLESNSITLSRAGRATTFPARFQLLMTASPCPCGNYGSSRPCLCSVRSIEGYWKRLGGTLFDRVPIRVVDSSGDNDSSLSLKEMRETVARTWKKQLSRQGCLNHYIDKSVIDEMVNKYSKLFPEGMSSRGMYETVKVARTLADIDDRDSVEEKDIIKSLSLRGKLPTE